MRINTILLSFLLTFALPTASAVPVGRGADVGMETSPEISEGYDVSPANTAEAAMWAWVQSSSINAYLPSALRVIGVVQAFLESEPSSLSDFWELAKKSEKVYQACAHCLLEDAALHFKSTEFTDVISAMNQIVNVTATFRDNIEGALDARQITFDAFTEELEGTFMATVNSLGKIALPHKTTGRAERAEVVNKVLDVTSQALIKLAAHYGIQEEVVTYLLALRPHVQALTVAIGDINEQYPGLLPLLIPNVAALVIPNSWIVKPFLGVFGLGPASPVGGPTADWSQGRSGELAVNTGMGVLSEWPGLMAKAPLLVGGILLLLRFIRR